MSVVPNATVAIHRGRTKSISLQRDALKRCVAPVFKIGPWRVDRIRVVCFVCVACLILSTKTASAAEPLKASIDKESAWTGEAVLMVITLYSPGPFDGTASFDLPELSRTSIIKIGNPVVGSEDVGDESFLTQRHEFNIYTQRSGTIVIPPFEVRFRGKESFVGDVKSVNATTSELKFESKRPPGTDSLGVVIATEKLNCEQSWTPDSLAHLKAGDVIERTVTRRVTGTSSMMLSPASSAAPEGIRVYTSDPEVVDKVTRGALDASRVDTIKYQVQKPGTFELPELTFTWWDPKAEKLQQTTLDGLTLTVAALPVGEQSSESAATTPTEKPYTSWAMGVSLLVALAVLYRPVKRIVEARRLSYHSVAARASREVRSACRANDARAAYAAVLAWCRIHSDRHEPLSPEGLFGDEWNRLSSYLFASGRTSSGWSGSPLLHAFNAAVKRRENHQRQRSRASLPAINPSH